MENKYPPEYYITAIDLSVIDKSDLVKIVSDTLLLNKLVIPLCINHIYKEHPNETILISDFFDMVIKEASTIIDTSLNKLIDTGLVQFSVDNDGNFVYFSTNEGLKLVNKLRKTENN